MRQQSLTILVHGGFHWGGCFAKVADVMAERGHPAAAPDLAGHGFNATLLADIKTMGDYVEPVEQLVAKADRPVVLVGHSMGGLTLSYLAERYPDKISRLIYLAALMLPAGLSAASLPAQDSPITSLITPSEDGRGMRIRCDVNALKIGFYADCSDRDVSVALANLTRVNPLAPFVWVSDVTAGNFGRVPRTYIETLQDKTLLLPIQRPFQTNLPGASVHSLDTSHSPFLSCPRAVADLILAA